jgi:hypothetical protein
MRSSRVGFERHSLPGHYEESAVLIEILVGSDRRSAKSLGAFQFARPPEQGEKIELDGEMLKVISAWHRPDIYYPGAKFAALAERE